VVRSILVGGPFPWSDLANALVFVAILLLLSRRPGWLRPLAWLGLGSFFVNTWDGLAAPESLPITSTHVLLPALVLYGALLGDVPMCMAAMLGVLGIYVYTGITQWPLDHPAVMILSNFGFVTVCSALAALAVWSRYRRLVEVLHLQADDLRRELDERLRLNALLHHDLRNPLTALTGALRLARMRPAEAEENFAIMEQMADRMIAIVASARELEAGPVVAWSRVAAGALRDQMQSLFAARLAEKGQTLSLAAGGDLAVRTRAEVLGNSVLANLVGNAIKFSPRGATIEMAAQLEGGQVRIEVRDRGSGFPDEVLTLGACGRRYASRAGTAGETGSACGLRIAALCVQRLRGRLEIRNLPGGGASAAVVLPWADAADHAPADLEEIVSPGPS
jgi:signal transduction histidine kinase